MRLEFAMLFAWFFSFRFSVRQKLLRRIGFPLCLFFLMPCNMQKGTKAEYKKVFALMPLVRILQL